RAVAPEVRQRAEGAQEGLLPNVVRLLPVSDEMVSVAIDGLRAVAVQRSERLQVAGPAAGEQALLRTLHHVSVCRRASAFARAGRAPGRDFQLHKTGSFDRHTQRGAAVRCTDGATLRMIDTQASRFFGARGLPDISPESVIISAAPASSLRNG